MKRLNDPYEATRFLAEALDAYERRGIDKDPAAARLHDNLATQLIELKRLADARPHLEKAAEIYRATLGSDNVSYALAEFGLATALRAPGDEKAAKAHRAVVDEVVKRTLIKIGDAVTSWFKGLKDQRLAPSGGARASPTTADSAPSSGDVGVKAGGRR